MAKEKNSRHDTKKILTNHLCYKSNFLKVAYVPNMKYVEREKRLEMALHG